MRFCILETFSSASLYESLCCNHKSRDNIVTENINKKERLRINRNIFLKMESSSIYKVVLGKSD